MNRVCRSLHSSICYKCPQISLASSHKAGKGTSIAKHTHTHTHTHTRTHTEKWPNLVYLSAFASNIRSINLGVIASLTGYTSHNNEASTAANSVEGVSGGLAQVRRASVLTLYPDLWSRASLAV